MREVLRGPREVLELHATQRVLKAEPWLDEAGVRVQVKPERELTAEAGTQDHQGVVARVEPYRYADAHDLASGPTPLLAVLDSVTDPRSLGSGPNSQAVYKKDAPYKVKQIVPVAPADGLDGGMLTLFDNGTSSIVYFDTDPQHLGGSGFGVGDLAGLRVCRCKPEGRCEKSACALCIRAAAGPTRGSPTSSPSMS